MEYFACTLCSRGVCNFFGVYSGPRAFTKRGWFVCQHFHVRRKITRNLNWVGCDVWFHLFTITVLYSPATRRTAGSASLASILEMMGASFAGYFGMVVGEQRQGVSEWVGCLYFSVRVTT